MHPASPRSTQGAVLLLLSAALSVVALGASPPEPPPPARADTSAAIPAARALLLDAAASARGLVAVGERGAVLLSADSGRTWSRRPAPPGDTLTGVCFAADGLRGWAVGHQGRILATADGGLSWKSNYTHDGVDGALLDVACLGPDHVVAIGAFGLALESRDAGASWQALSLPCEDRHLNRITPLPGGGAFIAGEAGLLLRSNPAGDSWSTAPSPYPGSLFGVLPLSNGALLAHGLRGTVLLAEAGAQGAAPHWNRIPTPAAGLLSTAVQTRSGTLVLAGQARVLLISRDFGRSFSAWEVGLGSAVAELVETPDHSLLALGEAGVTVLPPPAPPAP